MSAEDITRHGAYLADGTPVFCTECGNIEFEQKNYMDGYLIVETSYHCVHCRNYVAHWAYGGFDPAFYECADRETL